MLQLQPPTPSSLGRFRSLAPSSPQCLRDARAYISHLRVPFSAGRLGTSLVTPAVMSQR